MNSSFIFVRSYPGKKWCINVKMIGSWLVGIIMNCCLVPK